MVQFERYVGAWVPISDINISNESFRFRKTLNTDLLAESMSKNGQSFPIVLWKRHSGELQVVCGFGRLSAARKLGWERILAAIISEHDMNEEQALGLNFRENLQHKTFTNLDIMFACKKLSDQGKSNVDIGLLMGKSEGMVRRYLAIANAPADLQEKLKGGEVTLADASVLAARNDYEAILKNTNTYVKSTNKMFEAKLKIPINPDSTASLDAFILEVKKVWKEAVSKKREVERARRRKEALKLKKALEASAPGDTAALPPAPEGTKNFYISGPQKVGIGQTITLIAEAFREDNSKIAGIAPLWRSKDANLALFKAADNAETADAQSESVTLVGKAPGICYIKAVLGGFSATYMVEVV